MAETNFHALHQFTTQLVATASQWAKDGDIDKARDVVRYIRNAQIVPILSAQCYVVGEPNWPLLRWKVDQLSQQCHPEEAISRRTGFPKNVHPEN
jgi:hypothetical protein